MRPLERRERLGDIIFCPRVDRAGREAQPIEQHLRLEHNGVRPPRRDRALVTGGIDGLSAEQWRTGFLMMPTRPGRKRAAGPNDGGQRNRPSASAHGERNTMPGQVRAHPMV